MKLGHLFFSAETLWRNTGRNGGNARRKKVVLCNSITHREVRLDDSKAYYARRGQICVFTEKEEDIRFVWKIVRS